ncbi:MAG: amidohydrolase family protein [Lachnospiraceae bacterium]|nr:amidohydrolase family protein [Lachnospiraceae bacterium]
MPPWRSECPGTASWQRSSIEDKKGSITAGKEADFLVFDKDLLTAQKEGFSYNKPAEVYFAGKKVN